MILLDNNKRRHRVAPTAVDLLKPQPGMQLARGYWQLGAVCGGDAALPTNTFTPTIALSAGTNNAVSHVSLVWRRRTLYKVLRSFFSLYHRKLLLLDDFCALGLSSGRQIPHTSFQRTNHAVTHNGKSTSGASGHHHALLTGKCRIRSNKQGHCAQ